jgi:hypothetical protein
MNSLSHDTIRTIALQVAVIVAMQMDLSVYEIEGRLGVVYLLVLIRASL